MTNQASHVVKFTHENKFDVSKFDEYRFDEYYKGPIFSTCHNGVGYKWRMFIKPNGGRFDHKLDNGEWSKSKEDRENLLHGLEFLGGPLSSVSVNWSLKVKPSDESAAVLHKTVASDCLFTHIRHNWVTKMATRQELEKDGNFANGFFRVSFEIKMSLDLFDPTKILQKLKEEISLEKENISAVSSVFFDSVETEPSHGICLKLFCGAEKRIFYCIPQILETNSEYFRYLLNSKGDFKELKQSQIEFQDKDPEGVYAALRYIYLKELPQNFKEVAAICLPVAHLFLLPGLVLECERVLIGDLSSENDVEMTVLADTYDMSLLKNMAMNSMAMHFEDVSDNSDLKNKSALWDEFITLVACRSRSAANGPFKQN